MEQTSISPSVFTFLRKLSKNNNREWFAEHKEQYNTAYEEVKRFFNAVQLGMSAFDEIEQMRVHRIYRDIRFSKDKTPYKNHFSGGFRRATVYRRGGYYLHLEPNNSFVAGGFFAPNKDDLLRIRKEIEIDGDSFNKVIKQKRFQDHFGDLEGDEVKTVPRGFEKEHRHIDLLRKKQFYFTHRFSNKEVHDANFVKHVLTSYKNIQPFFNYMSEVLTTDLNGTPIV